MSWTVVVMIILFWFTGKLCIEVTSASKLAFISEELCIGCGICVKVGCQCIQIIARHVYVMEFMPLIPAVISVAEMPI
jgi:ferredoxin